MRGPQSKSVKSEGDHPSSGSWAIEARMRKIERREWWLWASAILVTLLLTLGIVSFIVPLVHFLGEKIDGLQLNAAARGLVALVLLFDLYAIYQQLQIFRIRRRLRDREELFRLITENAADLIAVVDARGKRLYNSPAYEKVLGYTEEELRSTSSIEQVHPEDRERVQNAAKQALTQGIGRRIEYRMRHKDGSWRHFESTASAIRGRDGKVEKLVIVNRDISSRIKLEEQFHQAQKMEAVGRLSGGVAHDFNNLLGVIIGYGEVLQEQLDEKHSLRISADEILKAARRAATLTRQLLAFSRLQVLEPKVLDLNAVVLDMEKMLRRLIREDIELNTVLDANLNRVKTDQGQIEQVVMNLAVNARDAMPDGGKLTIATHNTRLDDVYASGRTYPIQQGEYVCLTVADTGIGMDATTKARIFEPFFTTKEKGQGTGLGLSTVYGVVKQSGGYIDVFSEPDTGTTFKIYLPLAQGEIVPEMSSAGNSEDLSGDETVLLVEDEGALRTLAGNQLQMMGYKVITAQDGGEALDLSDKYDGDIHLLLTDIVMPGMSGQALAQELSQRRLKLKILYMSGYTGQRITGSGALTPGSHFIQKPFTREALARKVRAALSEPRQGAMAEAAAKGR